MTCSAGGVVYDVMMLAWGRILAPSSHDAFRNDLTESLAKLTIAETVNNCGNGAVKDDFRFLLWN